MSTTSTSNDDGVYVVDGIKLRRRRFGNKPVSERFPVPANLAAPAREPFTLHWEDPLEGFRVVIRENEAGRMIVDVTTTGATKPPFFSVGIVGTVEYESTGTTVTLTPTNATEGHGSADMGPLVDLAKRLGDAWWVVAFPMG